MKPFTANASTVAATLAGAVTAVVVWAIGTYTAHTVPPDIASAITAIITIAVQAFVPDQPITPAEAVRAQVEAKTKGKK